MGRSHARAGARLKPRRVSDPKLLAEVRKLPCLGCLKTPSHPHHVRSRGAGGDDVAINLMPLCEQHHRLVHQLGLATVARQFPVIHNWLELAGWVYDVGRARWLYPSGLDTFGRGRHLPDAL